MQTYDDIEAEVRALARSIPPSDFGSTRAIHAVANLIMQKLEAVQAKLDEDKRLRALLAAYVADEDRFNAGDGEPYGSIATETGIRARAAVKKG
jgi:hypothetical protein